MIRKIYIIGPDETKRSEFVQKYFSSISIIDEDIFVETDKKVIQLDASMVYILMPKEDDPEWIEFRANSVNNKKVCIVENF